MTERRRAPTAQEIVRHTDDAPPEGLSPYVDGRRPRTGIRIVPPDLAWPATYQGLADRVRAALGERVLELDHVGSTSVPGLPAKPIIDIVLVVDDPAAEAAWVPDLEAAGFELAIREPWWHEHRMMRMDRPHANLHVFGPESPEPIRMRMFRDWLHDHPEDLARYRDAKLAAAIASNAAGEHVMDYNARKEPVIRDIYDRAFRAAGLL
jgi:GrpB-like predicted nucleotidyltransferase (UPF0157 family)